MLIELTILTSNFRNKEICKKYWKQYSNYKFELGIEKLTAKYNISLEEIESTLEQHCIAKIPETKCTLCNKFKVIKKRSDYEEILKTRSNEETEYTCSDCFQSQIKDLGEQLSKKTSNYQQSKYSHITITDLIYLTAIARNTSNGVFHYNKDNKKQDFSPSPWFTNEIYSSLEHKGIISIRQGAKIDKTTGFPVSYIWYYTKKFKKLKTAQGQLYAMKKVMCESGYESSMYDYSNLRELIKQVLVEEGVHILKNALKKEGYKYEPTLEIQQLIHSFLTEISIAQFHNIIWQCLLHAKEDREIYMSDKRHNVYLANPNHEFESMDDVDEYKATEQRQIIRGLKTIELSHNETNVLPRLKTTYYDPDSDKNTNSDAIDLFGQKSYDDTVERVISKLQERYNSNKYSTRSIGVFEKFDYKITTVINTLLFDQVLQIGDGYYYFTINQILNKFMLGSLEKI